MKRILTYITMWGLLLSTGIAISQAQEVDIRDVRGPVEYPLNPVFIGLLFVIVFIVIIFLVLMIGKYKKLRPKRIRIKVKSPWEIAIDHLNLLMEKDYVETNKFDLFYTELSGILRSYLENNYSIRAPEMTTEEFLFSIRKNDLLFGKQKEILKEFLVYADMVKFARVTPSRKEAESGFRLAKEFVEQTKKE
ncbi:MAG: hypothetical protein AB7S78_04750 [Candidatus Omnitrophota bacterium]